MFQRLAVGVFVLIAIALCGIADAQQKRTGAVTGEIKAKKNTPNGRNTIIDVLAPGEEKARPYFVKYDPAIKGPDQKILAAVRAANIGDRVRLEWVDTGEGLAMTAFQVLKKASNDDKR